MTAWQIWVGAASASEGSFAFTWFEKVEMFRVVEVCGNSEIELCYAERTCVAAPAEL